MKNPNEVIYDGSFNLSDCTLETALNIKHGAYPLRFYSRGDYNKTILEIENKTGKITEILENTVVLITIITYAFNSLSYHKEFAHKQSTDGAKQELQAAVERLAEQFIYLYSALMGYDDSSHKIIKLSLPKSLNFNTDLYEEQEKVWGIGDPEDETHGWDIKTYLESLEIKDTSIFKYIVTLPKKWNLSGIKLKVTSTWYLCSVIISRFFSLNLYDTVRKRLNIDKLIIDDMRYVKSYTSKIKAVNDDMKALSKYRILGYRVLRNTLYTLDLTNFNPGVLRRGNAIKLEETQVVKVHELNTLLQTPKTKILSSVVLV